ncbi:energy transducer TonB [Rhodoblastus sp.]|uniref:energy transducer TonB n=1 Tax=Rhodoblastus sp. TaxID=1962975 RepID=UPI003F94EA9D
MTPDSKLSLALGLSQRVGVVSGVASLHVLVLAGSLLIGSEMVAPPTVLGVDVVAQGELAFEAGEAPAPDSPVVSPPVAEPAAEAAQAQRQEVARNEPQKAPPAPATDDSGKNPPLAKDQPQPRQAQAQATPQPAQAAASRLGAENSREAVSSSSRRRYTALVSAEINRHKFYPSAARGKGGGMVGITFEIGADGALLRQQTTRTSGDDLLDEAARKMVASANFPAPPGGRFFGKIEINFRLRKRS